MVGLITFIPALARFSSLWAAGVVLRLIGGRCPPGKNIQHKYKNVPVNFLLPLPFIPPLLFQQMSSLFLQWLALEGHTHFSSNCTRPECFECLPKDNRIHHADLRNELLLNQFMQRQRKQRQQHGFCQHEGDSSNYIKPQGNWSNLSADKVSSHFLQTENQKGKYCVL